MQFTKVQTFIQGKLVEVCNQDGGDWNAAGVRLICYHLKLQDYYLEDTEIKHGAIGLKE